MFVFSIKYICVCKLPQCLHAEHVAVVNISLSCEYDKFKPKSHIFLGGEFQRCFVIHCVSAHVSVGTTISGAISECLPNEIMQTCTHSNKVGQFAEIQPRLFPEEKVVSYSQAD